MSILAASIRRVIDGHSVACVFWSSRCATVAQIAEEINNGSDKIAIEWTTVYHKGSNDIPYWGQCKSKRACDSKDIKCTT